MEIGWLWLTCFILSLLLLVTSAVVFFTKKIGIMRFLYAVAGGFMSVYFVYIPLYIARYDLVPALLGNFLKVLKVITLDENVMESCEFVRQFSGQYGPVHEVFGFVYEILLVIIHLLLPLLFTMTAVTLLMQCVSRLRLGFMRKSKKAQHIFSEVNYKSTLLAKDIRKQHPKDSIIFLEKDKEKDHADLRESLHCTILNENIENIHSQAKKRQVHYYCISANEEENINSALAILDDLQALPVQVQKRFKLYLFSTAPITEPMVDSLEKGMVELNVINEYQSVAYQLLQEHLLLDAADEDKKISLLLCGFREVNRELIRAASWCSCLPGYRLKIRVVGDISEDQQADFKAACPGLFQGDHDIAFIRCTNDRHLQSVLAGPCADAGYIVVAEETETKTVERAVQLRRFYYRNDPHFAHAPKIFAHIENKDRAAAVARLQTAHNNPARRAYYQIIPFGGADQVYTYHNITDSSLEWLSKNVHLEYDYTYLALQGKQAQQNVDAQLQEYNRFEVNKRSNRTNALHIRYKLAYLGLDCVPADPEKNSGQLLQEDTALLQSRLNETELYKLMVAEHERWQAFHESEGWRTASIRQVQAYTQAGLSGGTHKCALLQMHPYICDFEDLKSRAELLEKEDSTIYDRTLIENIPAIISGQRRDAQNPPRRFQLAVREPS